MSSQRWWNANSSTHYLICTRTHTHIHCRLVQCQNKQPWMLTLSARVHISTLLLRNLHAHVPSYRSHTAKRFIAPCQHVNLINSCMCVYVCVVWVRACWCACANALFTSVRLFCVCTWVWLCFLQIQQSTEYRFEVNRELTFKICF